MKQAEVKTTSGVTTKNSTKRVEPAAQKGTKVSTMATKTSPKSIVTKQVHVTKENLDKYFSLMGNATYDPKTGIVTYTEDKKSQVGSAP
ncbi:lectin-like domain-containing protein [Weissella minor]|uniref:lectin-like domain-containing protein n=1 Tax=Weissella minor TaxID=1620 RepID=UPI003AF20B6F